MLQNQDNSQSNTNPNVKHDNDDDQASSSSYWNPWQVVYFDEEKEMDGRVEHPFLYMSNAEFLEYSRVIADGFNIEKYYDDLELCLISTSTTINRLGRSKEAWADKEKSRFDAWISTTLSTGNLSQTYQYCFNSSEYAMTRFSDYMSQYRSVSFYILNLIPNLLSQAFVYNIWIDKINEYEANGNKTGLVYVYCVIIRSLFFFKVQTIDDLDDPNLDNQYSNNYILKKSQSQQPESNDPSWWKEYKKDKTNNNKNSVKVEEFHSILQQVEQLNDMQLSLFSSYYKDLSDELILSTRAFYRQHQKLADSYLERLYFRMELDYKWQDYSYFVYIFSVSMLKDLLGSSDDSQLINCDSNIQAELSQIRYAGQQYTMYPGGIIGSDSMLSNFKTYSFSQVRIFDYLYEVTMFCYGTGPEVSRKIDDFEIFDTNQEILRKNVFYWFGSLLYYSVTFEDCYQSFDAECSGQKVGQFISKIFDLDVLNGYSE